MLDKIKIELRKLELERNIKILYAVESGSRAWGFASTNSDWDVRFIYVHNYDWYLSIEEKKDNIEFILPNDIDLSGWELKKALLLYRKSNPPLLEWLRSPIIYQENFSTADDLRKNLKSFFNPKSCLYHYLHMARGNYEAYFKEHIVRLKKYFYVLRPIFACNWIEQNNDMAPMEFEATLNNSLPSGELRNKIDELLQMKMKGEELDKGNRIRLIDNYIEEKLDYFTKYLENFVYENRPDFNDLNRIFRNTLKEAWK
jgi:predicted nucleotidyltransferase